MHTLHQIHNAGVFFLKLFTSQNGHGLYSTCEYYYINTNSSFLSIDLTTNMHIQISNREKSTVLTG